MSIIILLKNICHILIQTFFITKHFCLKLFQIKTSLVCFIFQLLFCSHFSYPPPFIYEFFNIVNFYNYLILNIHFIQFIGILLQRQTQFLIFYIIQTSYNQKHMEFVAHKLGFLKCNPQSQNQTKSKTFQSHKRPHINLGNPQQTDTILKKRKLSSQQSSSTQSIKSDLSLGKLKISDSIEEETIQIKNKNKTFISIPTPIRVNNTITSKSFVPTNEFSQSDKPANQVPYMNISKSDNIPSQFNSQNFIITNSMLNSSLFLQNDYLSFLYTPYNTGKKMIGNISEVQRRIKVQRYLQKKRNRQWKNVRYTVRQQLAQNRKREQGRFMKSDKKWRWNEIPVNKNSKQQGKNIKKEEDNQGEQFIF